MNFIDKLGVFIDGLSTIEKIISIVGSVLTVYLSLKAIVSNWSRKKTKLDLTAGYRLQVNGLGLKPNNIRLTWKIKNNSAFDVQINSAGFMNGNSKSSSDKTYSIPAIFLERVNFPAVIKPDETLEFSLADGNQMEEARDLGYMYVETNTGYSKAVKLPFPTAEVFSRPRQEYRLPS